TYLIVDCGGGTVDLTARKLLPNNQLSENTERSGHYCGSTYVDRNFVEFLKKKVGEHAISMLRDKHYRQFHYMVQQFCERAKIPFTDKISEFRTFEFDILKYCPALKLYIKNSVKDELEQDDWIIDIDYETVKSFFDPVVNQIIILISDQLSKISQCSIIYMVGGFSESKYLQARIKERFSSYTIAIPPHPVAAIVRGAVEYGLDMDTIKTRVLKWTYGVQIYPLFKEGVDPPSRKTSDGHIYKFNMLAKRGVEVAVNQEFSDKFIPFKQNQRNANIKLFYSSKHYVEYCDEPE
ncbi:2237_t:CDS:1, partial [Dentiscutata heterogama]